MNNILELTKRELLTECIEFAKIKYTYAYLNKNEKQKEFQIAYNRFEVSQKVLYRIYLIEKNTINNDWDGFLIWLKEESNKQIKRLKEIKKED